MKAALTDSVCLMVNRNAGAGTRILIDQLLGGAKPKGYSNQPKSHNAVAAAIAQARADWGVAIAPVAALYGLAFMPGRAGALRFPPGRGASRKACGTGVSGYFERRAHARTHPRHRHAAGLITMMTH